MQDIVIALLAIVIGALFCLRGYLAMRTLIPLWGAFAGFLLGAGLVDASSDDGFLRSTLAWFVGLAIAIVFAGLAYLYYEVSVLLAMGAVGFALGTSLMVALGVRWSWLIVLAGLAVGLALAVVAMVSDFPAVLLIILTATGGASAVVFGLMLLTGVVDAADLDQGATTARIEDDWWWYALYVALAVAGVAAQANGGGSLRRSTRDQWTEAGGGQLRTP